jgi:hypothetical protein
MVFLRAPFQTCRLTGSSFMRASLVRISSKTIEMVAEINTLPDPQAEAWGE